jgi:hypothetical protein
MSKKEVGPYPRGRRKSEIRNSKSETKMRAEYGEGLRNCEIAAKKRKRHKEMLGFPDLSAVWWVLSKAERSFWQIRGGKKNVSKRKG